MEERHGGRREVRKKKKKKKKKNDRSVCTDCRRIKISRTDAAGKGLWGNALHCTALHCLYCTVLYLLMAAVATRRAESGDHAESG
jgi:ribosomal protein L37AE/L43A